MRKTKVTDINDRTPISRREIKARSAKMTSEQELSDNICLLISGWAYRTGMPIDQRINLEVNHRASQAKYIDAARDKASEAYRTLAQAYSYEPDIKKYDEAREAYDSARQIYERIRDKKCQCWNCRIVRMYQFFDAERQDDINKTSGQFEK